MFPGSSLGHIDLLPRTGLQDFMVSFWHWTVFKIRGVIAAQVVGEGAQTTPGKRSLAMESFAAALRAIPATICDNAGARCTHWLSPSGSYWGLCAASSIVPRAMCAVADVLCVLRYISPFAPPYCTYTCAA